MNFFNFGFVVIKLLRNHKGLLRLRIRSTGLVWGRRRPLRSTCSRHLNRIRDADPPPSRLFFSGRSGFHFHCQSNAWQPGSGASHFSNNIPFIKGRIITFNGIMIVVPTWNKMRTSSKLLIIFCQSQLIYDIING